MQQPRFCSHQLPLYVQNAAAASITLLNSFHIHTYQPLYAPLPVREKGADSRRSLKHSLHAFEVKAIHRGVCERILDTSLPPSAIHNKCAKARVELTSGKGELRTFNLFAGTHISFICNVYPSFLQKQIADTPRRWRLQSKMRR